MLNTNPFLNKQLQRFKVNKPDSFLLLSAEDLQSSALFVSGRISK